VEHALSNNAIRDFPSTPAVSGFRNDVIRWPSRAAAGRSSDQAWGVVPATLLARFFRGRSDRFAIESSSQAAAVERASGLAVAARRPSAVFALPAADRP
jgi:hypothetical protein